MLKYLLSPVERVGGPLRNRGISAVTRVGVTGHTYRISSVEVGGRDGAGRAITGRARNAEDPAWGRHGITRMETILGAAAEGGDLGLVRFI